MRTILAAGALAALTFAVAGHAALAQSSPMGGAPTDADGGPRLSRAEFVAARLQRLAAADADGDGLVTRDEMRAAVPAGRSARLDARFERLAGRGPVVIAEAQVRAEAAFTRLDTDGDGFVTAAERRAARADRRAAGRPSRASPPAPALE